MAEKTGKKVTAPGLLEMKKRGEKIAVLTAYDYPTARLMDASGIDVILVGDSVGENILGYDTTLPVTMDEMMHHVKAVARGVERAMIVADMPFMSYQSGRKQAIENAGRFLKEGGAHSVKLEGGAAVAETVAELVSIGIPVMGHIGMTPQSVHLLGGHRKQGKTPEAQEALIDDARILQEAGAFAIVIELVPTETAEMITEAVEIPTIGIGAGPHCDGQVLVVTDLLGMDERVYLKHVKQYAKLHKVMTDAFRAYSDDVKSGHFPEG